MSTQSDKAEWVSIGNFSTGFQADMARQLLEAEDIPVLVNSNAPGIFGAAFQGTVVGGITLQVPSPLLGRARMILEQGNEDDYDEMSP